MNNKVIFFSIDRLGDYLIRSNVIFNISKFYKFNEIISSEKNFKLINTQSFFDKVILFDTNKKNINKIKFIFKYCLKKYDSAISFDGKSISNILVIIIRANFKHLFIYKKKGLINNLKFLTYCKFLKLINITYTILYSRELIEENYDEHYPLKYKRLNKIYDNINKKTYYLEDFGKKKSLDFDDDFILIHLDEKFIDIIDIKMNFSKYLNIFEKKLSKKIILTSFNNKHEYYQNLSIEKIPFNNIDNFNLKDKKIFILEDIPLENFYNLIKKSVLNISCHAGFFIHASMLNNKKTIDIINISEEKWLNTWITKTDSYKMIYKSNLKQKFTINEILEKISNEIKNI